MNDLEMAELEYDTDLEALRDTDPNKYIEYLECKVGKLGAESAEQAIIIASLNHQLAVAREKPERCPKCNARLKPKPPRYPMFLYHPTKPPLKVENRKQERALSSRWRDTPWVVRPPKRSNTRAYPTLEKDEESLERDFGTVQVDGYRKKNSVLVKP